MNHVQWAGRKRMAYFAVDDEDLDVGHLILGQRIFRAQLQGQ